MIIKEEDLRNIAENAASKAIEKLFLTLGMDISTPTAVLTVQDQFKHLKNQYEACNAVKRYGFRGAIAAFGTILTALIGYFLVALGIQTGSLPPH